MLLLIHKEKEKNFQKGNEWDNVRYNKGKINSILPSFRR